MRAVLHFLSRAGSGEDRDVQGGFILAQTIVLGILGVERMASAISLAGPVKRAFPPWTFMPRAARRRNWGVLHSHVDGSASLHGHRWLNKLNSKLDPPVSSNLLCRIMG